MSEFSKPFLVALDGHPEIADLIAEQAETVGFDALALQDQRMLETAVAVAAADVLVVDLDHADHALSALGRQGTQQTPPLVILMTDAAISGAATPVGLAAEVVATLTKPLTQAGLRDALGQAMKGIPRNGLDG